MPDTRQAAALGITDAAVDDARIGRAIMLQAGRIDVVRQGLVEPCHLAGLDQPPPPRHERR
jgi:hypothetical protein